MRNCYYNLAGFLLALSFVCAPVAANPRAHFPQAETIEKVTCKADPAQSYALFLPPGYTPEKKWPIIYAFDPVGRGTVPVKLFQAAATKFGFIIVGSNNSRNGIDVSAIVKTLWTDTHERFSIDERRVYTTGFSGGARVASAVALGYPGAVAGVIAASGGLPSSARLSSSNQFVFFGTAGTEDFNFPEMQQLKRKLDEVGIANRLAIFAGGHDWPPPEMCSEAVGWLEVQAMKSGSRAKDEKLIDERLSLKLKAARDFETASEIYEAYLEYEALVTEFRGLRDTNEFAAAALRLSGSKEVKAGIKNERAEEDSQASLSAKLQSLIAQLQNSETYPEAIVALKSNLSDLAKKSEGGRSVAERRVAQRVLQSLVVQIYEEAFALKQRKNYASIPAKLELLVLIHPKDPRVFYDLAASYARIGNKTKATTALGRAIEWGFSDLSRIDQDEDFATLRDEADYKKLIGSLKKS
jgi:pimeloyl-ACP methyl ester carboxylesterase